jgi:DNA repair exonuclease SbcCD ATPase subunit
MEAFNMTEQITFFNRIGRLFKRPARSNGDPMTPSDDAQTNALLVRPWGRNQMAISQLQEGFQSLTELINAIRQNMENQGRRQDEMLEHLSALPKVLEMIPESNRMQSQTLTAIHDQLMQQADQQHTLGEILSKLSEAGVDQRAVLEGLRERVETLNQQDRAMADSLNTVSAAMESASRNSATSAQVLGQLKENLETRHGDLEHMLYKQGTRFTTMLAITTVVSVAALVAVVVIGYLMLHPGK